MFKQVLTCADQTRNGTFDVPVTLTISHAAGTAFTLISTAPGLTCTYTGT